MFSSILMTFLCADISCVETAAAGRRAAGAPPAPRLMPTPPGRPIGRPGMEPPERMSRRGCVLVFVVLRGSYCTRRGTGAPAARGAAGAGMGTPGLPAHVSIPVRGALEGRGDRAPLE